MARRMSPCGENEIQRLAPVYHADRRTMRPGLEEREHDRVFLSLQLAIDSRLILPFVDDVGTAMGE